MVSFSLCRLLSGVLIFIIGCNFVQSYGRFRRYRKPPNLHRTLEQGLEIGNVTKSAFKEMYVNLFPHLVQPTSKHKYMEALYKTLANSDYIDDVNKKMQHNSSLIRGIQATASSRHPNYLCFNYQSEWAYDVTTVILVLPIKVMFRNYTSNATVSIFPSDHRSGYTKYNPLTQNVFGASSWPYQIFNITKITNVLNVTDRYCLVVYFPLKFSNNGHKFFDLKSIHDEPLIILFSKLVPFQVGMLINSSYKKSLIRKKRFISSLSSTSNYCHLKHWYVKFLDIGFDYLIQPIGVSINLCSGKCPSLLLSEHLNATNHAFIKAVYAIHHKELRKAAKPKVCCVPIKYSPISVMFEEKPTVIVIKILQDIVATACGCR